MRSKILGSLWAIFGIVTLVYFQNCAPAPTGQLDGLGVVDGELRSVDQWDSGVSFMSSNYEVRDPSQDVRIDGRCEGYSGAEVAWEMSDLENSVLLDGAVSCVADNFKLVLSELPFTACGDILILRAQVGDDEVISTNLEAQCP